LTPQDHSVITLRRGEALVGQGQGLDPVRKMLLADRCPVAVSQTRTVLSSLPETISSRSPARPTATASTGLVWPARGWPTGCPVAASPSKGGIGCRDRRVLTAAAPVALVPRTSERQPLLSDPMHTLGGIPAG
jgi:hypothetical protein